MADFEDAQKPNGGFLEVDGGDDLTLYLVLHRLMAAIFFPDPTSSAPLLRRVKISVADNVPLLRPASRNTVRNVALWTRRGSALRAPPRHLCWIGFFWTVWLVTKKSAGFAKHSLGMTGSAIAAYSSVRHVRRHHDFDKVSD
ncbi:hypothetical protein PVL29_004725 [Vitis rotundifolia]|uniref:Uncharacterized protein n=1 Tax=Vitis rotundifolia TaxID=103349 RepID=A0AA39E2V2_VITRO|nr:hypothetical protein PVL29_004725 [Vitis rotundifolia]